MNIPIDITGVELRSERLIMRPWRESDLDDFFEYASVDGVGQMAGWAPHESREKSKSILDMFIASKKVFAIEYAENGKVIGSLGIEKYDEKKFPEYAELRCRELGFVLAKPYWGMGLMPEAMMCALDWLFTELDADAVFCGHFVRNAQSARVQAKCGFHKAGETMHETRMGTLEPTVVNVLTMEEYISAAVLA